VLSKTKSGYSATRKNYMAQLICERLTGNREESFKTAAMQRGNDIEPKARARYMLETGELVEETGFINHPTISMSGASPDGLVGEDGLIEIKCPNTATHLEFLRTKKPKPEYLLQMFWQMACTGRKWCDFVSYDDRLKEHLSFQMVRINRDDEQIKEIEEEVQKFLHELNEQIDELDIVMEA
ncbi:lambda exonuclease family protein, partial [Snodgrassella alvi]|uniref:lambda exonuclease family protein n=1 Tax=Snodgrassella alvi TaxID=1196083 RepID=UPI0009D0813A